MRAPGAALTAELMAPMMPLIGSLKKPGKPDQALGVISSMVIAVWQ
jgi:hypothetical protein